MHPHQIDPIYLCTEEQALAWINSREEQFYVYVLVNPLNNLPFYVGKGQGNRCFKHWNLGSDHNEYLNNFMNKLYKKTEDILYAFYGFYKSEKRAYNAEADLINLYGLKRDSKNFLLYNLISGQETNKKSSRWARYMKKIKELPERGYDYSKANYKGYSKPITIICPEHGEFTQTVSVHLKGHGCAKCCGNYKLSQDEFITRAKTLHKNLYDYSLSKYTGWHDEVKIICPKHGEFKQTPAKHITLRRGCAGCKGGVKISRNYVIDQFIKVHGDKYDYSKVEYTNSNTNITVICRKHGEFIISPTHHKNGQGCQKCSDNRRPVAKLSLNKKEIIDTYDSLTLAAEAVNGSKTNIQKSCKDFIEHSIRTPRYGYYWKYL